MRLPAYGLFLALSAAFPLFAILNSPSDSKNAFVLGYSFERTLLSVGLISIIASLLFLTSNLIRQPGRSLRLWEKLFTRKGFGNTLTWLTLTGFIACWIALFMPSYRLPGNLAGYAAGLYPVIAWLAVVGAVTMRILIRERKQESISAVVSENKSALPAALIVFALLLLTGILAFTTGIGIRQPEDYWYGAGVPVLGLQILFSLIAGAAVLRMEPKLNNKFDLLMCVVLWGVTAWLWVREPLGANYFFPDTARNDIHPYSDSATFDLGSQFALIGQGLFNGQYFDRALYSAFLTFLHGIAGQDVERLMNVQAVVFAVFPIIVYLLGRELHSRALGVSAALLIALRGANAVIVSKWVDTASPKMMLTDFPTAIGVAAFMLFAIKWMKEPQKVHLAVLTGGMLGLTIMLRTHALLLLPMALFFLFALIRPRLKIAALGSLLLIMGMLFSTLPWDIRNQPNGAPMFYIYYYRIELILRERYGIKSGASVSPDDMNAPARQISHLRSAPGEKFIVIANDDLCNSSVCSVVNHFIHNFMTSVTFLPVSFQLDDLWNTVKLTVPFWKPDWAGSGLGASALGILTANLFIISVGFGAMWARSRYLALLPAFIFLTYILSNAFAFTSGGRYIAPVDWIVCVYFIAGLLHIASPFLKRIGAIAPFQSSPRENEAVESLQKPSAWNKRVIGSLVLVFAIGSLIPIAEAPFQERYERKKPDEVLAMLEQEGWLEKARLSKDELTEFLTDPQAHLITGRLLYPRYYPGGAGEPDSSYPYTPLEYSRLVFTIIGPYATNARGVIIPGLKPSFPLHAADVVVLGCQNEQFFDAFIVFALSEPGYIYHRFPEPPLQCPLQTP